MALKGLGHGLTWAFGTLSKTIISYFGLFDGTSRSGGSIVAVVARNYKGL